MVTAVLTDAVEHADLDQMSESLLHDARSTSVRRRSAHSNSFAMPTAIASTLSSCFAAIWPPLLITPDPASWCAAALAIWR